VTAVGGTTQVPEVAADFSGGGFSDVVRFVLFRSWCVATVLTRRRFQVPAPEVARGSRREVSQITA